MPSGLARSIAANSPCTARSTSAPCSGFTFERIIMTFIGCTTFRYSINAHGGTNGRLAGFGFVLQLLPALAVDPDDDHRVAPRTLTAPNMPHRPFDEDRTVRGLRSRP
jgi:hypothetical protein